MRTSTLSNEQTDLLASRVWKRRSNSPSLNYGKPRHRPQKEQVRSRILSFLTRKRIPRGLSILTMPGLRWTFERQLLAIRETQPQFAKGLARRTFITGIEHNEAIYRASLEFMPGRENGFFLRDRPFAWTTLHTTCAWHHRAELGEFIKSDAHNFDCAFLDFHGPMTEGRIADIVSLWRKIRRYLFVTVMNARQSKAISLIQEASGLSNYMGELLSESRLVLMMPYSDTTAMVAYGFERRS